QLALGAGSARSGCWTLRQRPPCPPACELTPARHPGLRSPPGHGLVDPLRAPGAIVVRNSGQSSLTTTPPSWSQTTVSPGTNSTPPISTTLSTSPSPVLVLLRGFVPSALTPKSISASTAESRTAPFTTTPLQPLERPISAITSPISAVCSDPWPSITRTWPSPGSESTFFSRALSWKQVTVRIRPENATRPPRLRNWTSQLRTSGPSRSAKSAVDKVIVPPASP